jgi:hypothetical protein
MTSEEIAAKPNNPDHEAISNLLWDTLYSVDLRSAG